VNQGDNKTYCVLLENPIPGTYSVGLYGHQSFLLVRNLMEGFRGSVYLKMFNERGQLVGLADSSTFLSGVTLAYNHRW
jgi:hypothetical protein